MKRISSKKLADEYTIVPASRLDGGEVFGYQHVKMVERAAFLAGWTARGKADISAALEIEWDNSAESQETGKMICDAIEGLDEQD